MKKLVLIGMLLMILSVSACGTVRAGTDNTLEDRISKIESKVSILERELGIRYTSDGRRIRDGMSLADRVSDLETLRP
jgi:hypothetical protein